MNTGAVNMTIALASHTKSIVGQRVDCSPALICPAPVDLSLIDLSLTDLNRIDLSLSGLKAIAPERLETPETIATQTTMGATASVPRLIHRLIQQAIPVEECQNADRIEAKTARPKMLSPDLKNNDQSPLETLTEAAVALTDGLKMVIVPSMYAPTAKRLS